METDLHLRGQTASGLFNTEDAAGYDLTLHDKAGTRALNVAPSKLPFDVSLGTDSRNRPTAVYSRCRVGERGWPSDAVVPGSCDLQWLYLKESGPRFRALARGGFGEENERRFGSPSFAGRYLYFTYSNTSTYIHPPNGWVLRRDLRTGRTRSAEAPGYLESVAADPLRPSTPLAISSFAGEDPETEQPTGTDAVQTLDAPAWRTPPKTIFLR